MVRALALAALVLAPAASAQVALVPRDYGLRLGLGAPADWETLRDQGMVRLAVLAPPAAGFRPNVNVVVEGVGPDVGLDVYVAESRAVLAETMPGYREVEAGPDVVGGRPAFRVRYDHATGGRPLAALVYVFVEGGRAFSLTATATPGAFDALRPLFQRIVQSVRTD